jgi:GNAT superfamily N-acetyltransferase
LFGRYDADHPDERKVGNHPKLLVHGSEYVGVVRIDLTSETAYLRRVAVDRHWQRQGFGRELLRLAEDFVIEHGIRRVESAVAPDAVSFYLKCHYLALPVAGTAAPSVRMYKVLAPAEQRVAPHGGEPHRGLIGDRSDRQ